MFSSIFILYQDLPSVWSFDFLVQYSSTAIIFERVCCKIFPFKTLVLLHGRGRKFGISHLWVKSCTLRIETAPFKIPSPPPGTPTKAMPSRKSWQKTTAISTWAICKWQKFTSLSDVNRNFWRFFYTLHAWHHLSPSLKNLWRKLLCIVAGRVRNLIPCPLLWLPRYGFTWHVICV